MPFKQNLRNANQRMQYDLTYHIDNWTFQTVFRLHLNICLLPCINFADSFSSLGSSVIINVVHQIAPIALQTGMGLPALNIASQRITFWVTFAVLLQEPDYVYQDGKIELTIVLKVCNRYEFQHRTA